MPSSIVHALLPASCVISSKSIFPKLTKKELFKLFAYSAFLGNMPDLDVIPASLAGDQWSHIHRSWGHNLFAVTLWIILGGIFFRKFVSLKFARKQVWILSILLVLSHLLFDSMQGPNTEGKLVGVPLFYPFSTKNYRLPLKIFQAVTIDKNVHFLVGYLTSMTFWKEIIYMEFLYILGFWFLWNLSFVLTTNFIRSRARRKQIEADIISFHSAQIEEKRKAI